MQAVENWANVTGRLVGAIPHPQLDGYLSAKLEVKSVEPLPGFANLFTEAQGQTIDVNIPAAAAADLEKQKGSTVSWRLRKAGPFNNFTHPDAFVR